MTKDQFIEGYCERSGITRESFLKYGDAVPCDCGEGSCQGWKYETQFGSLGKSADRGGFEWYHRPPSAEGDIAIQPGMVSPGDLVICAAENREVLRFRPDGTIEVGESYTPTEAAEAFIAVLRDMLPSKAENDKLKARLDELQSRRDRDWVLAMAAALGSDSGFSVPLVPEAEPFRKLFASLVEREKNG
jgi:hypothetical protein